MTPEETLIFKAAALAQRAPQEWSDLLATLELRSDKLRRQCVSSPADLVFMNQGRARECDELVLLLKTCVQTAGKIQEKRK
jgi:hypothetical protein